MSSTPRDPHLDLPPGVTIQSPGEGELGVLFQKADWGSTLLGPMESWPTTLQGYVRMILLLPSPAIIFWGPEQVQLYNDGYSVIMGPRHPRYLGSTYRECWPDTYPTIHPWMQRVLQGDIVKVDRTLIPVTRHGFNEEAFFTFSLSPLRDDEGRIAGILQLVTEMTGTVLAERREGTLRALLPAMDVHSPIASAAQAVEGLRKNPADIPYALLFLRDDPAAPLRLEAVVGHGADGAPLAIDEEERQAAHALAELVLARGEPLDAGDWQRFSRGRPSGPWPEPVKNVMALPLRRTDAELPRGILILGASPRLHFDGRYREFFRRAAREMANAFAVHQELALGEQLKLALESAKLGTWLLDLESHRIRLSPRTASFLGSETPVEADIERLNQDRVHPEDHARVEATWRAAVRDGELYSCEYRVRRTDGEVRWLHSWGRATYSRDGRPLVLSGVSLDITDTKRLVDELSAAVHARDEFMSIASHELKTPLTSILLQLQGQRRAMRREGAASPQQARFIEQLENQTTRLSRLVNDMLDVARIDSGKLGVVRVRTELCSLVRETVERLQPQFEAAHVPLELGTCGPLFVAADPDRLEQVVLNLLTNALRYGDRRPVQVRVSEAGGKALLTVRDEGRGLSPENAQRVFERFERAVSANEVSGLGLGLFISREIVLRHEGRIWVESEPGKGASFFVELPLLLEP